MTTRRGFLKLLGAGAALVPTLTWADMGGPAYLAAARRPDGSFALFGIDETGDDLFAVPLPDRAHSSAVHPHLAQAVVFGRRPGRYAVLFDCGSGAVLGTLTPPDGLVFCGHGAYDAPGARLYTSEAETETGAGRIGIWDASDGLRRIGMLDSGGTGPHECILLPGGRLAVANGAIENGADGKPDPLDLAEMQPNLTYIDLAAGTILQRLHLDGALRQNSIRHLAVRPDGLLAFAMQWHGDPTAKPALLGLHREGEAAPRLLAAPDALQAAMQGYAGSIAFSGDGQQVAISSPLGGLIDAFATETGAHAWRSARPDLCGLAPHGAGFAATTGSGDWLILDGTDATPTRITRAEAGRGWDNHMVALRTA